MSRVKAIYRSWAIPCSGKQVYAPRHRAEWLAKINEPGVHRHAEFYYQQLDVLRCLRQEVRRDLLAESKKHQAWKRLGGIPSIGPIRAAVLLGILQAPHRFRTKRHGRENPKQWANASSNRAPGADDQNRFCSIKWAAKQEKFRPLQECFFLTSPFIELTRSCKLETSIEQWL